MKSGSAAHFEDTKLTLECQLIESEVLDWLTTCVASCLKQDKCLYVALPDSPVSIVVSQCEKQ